MSPKCLLEHFEQISEAPDAVPRLRRLILDLAVRGKLVPQDPNDESASELLKKIADEKEQLIREGILKKQQLLEGVSDAEKPFEIPEGWKWERLGNIGLIGSSSRVHQRDWKNSGVPFFRAREIVQLSKHGIVDNDLFITEELFQSLSFNGLTPEPGDVMITGVGTIGVPYVVKKGDRFYFKDASVLILKNYFRIVPLFLRYVFESHYWIGEIHKDSMGTTVDTLTISRANLVPIPLPPLAAQHRIVAKVDELMKLCDELEAAQTKRERRRDRLVAATLHGLNNGVTDDDSGAYLSFGESARFYFNHLPSLTTRPEHMQQLRQTILNLAVRGKLVPQDPGDEPVSIMLGQIEIEKMRLVKEGKAKKQEQPNDINVDETPHEVPSHWAWSRLNNIGVLSGGMTPSMSRSDFWSGNIKWFSPKDIKTSEIFESALKITLKGLKETGLQLYQPGCLFIVARSGILKRTLPVSINRVAATANQDLKVLVPYLGGMERYLQIMLKGMEEYILSNLVKTGTTVQSLKYDEFENQPFPLPPLAEQHRIVAKVDELMRLCNALEDGITTATSTRRRFLEATLQEALTS